ncbi:CsbD family protein [Streptomyces sp. NPDC058067]|uniref:CsbD family protein n=1 Tax=Streptomyces sp. NPDC058067 TaxID=3346324 RepID=UPI0036E71FE2
MRRAGGKSCVAGEVPSAPEQVIRLAQLCFPAPGAVSGLLRDNREESIYSPEELIRVAGAGKKLHGKAQEAMGKAKQKAGRATGDNELRAEGTGDRVKGKARQAAGKAEQNVRGEAEELKGKIRKHT